MKIKKGLVFPRSQDEKHGSEDPDDHSPQTGTPSDADHHDKGRFHLQNLIFQPLIYTTNRQNGLRWRIVMETCTGLGSMRKRTGREWQGSRPAREADEDRRIAETHDRRGR